jgi:phosphatidate phosphatase LPIN
VTVKINDEEAPFVMKVGETGEAFFIFETQGDVPEELRTSPLVTPTEVEGETKEPDFFSLGESQVGTTTTQDTAEDQSRQPAVIVGAQ